MTAADELTPLAHAARAGDEDALLELVRRTCRPVRHSAAALVGEAAAERLTERTFARAVDRLPKFWGKAEARPWILGLARHACLDEVRACSRQRRAGSESSAGLEPPESGDHPPGLDPGLSARSSLDPELGVPFALTQLLGLSYQETATVCGSPVQLGRMQALEARETLVPAGGPV